MVIAKLILESIVTMLPKGLALGLKLIKLEKMGAWIAKNPKSTNGGGMTVLAASLVSLAVMLAESNGVVLTAEVQTSLIAAVVAIGGAYTAWRASIKPVE